MTDIVPNTTGYDGIRSDIVTLLESARRIAARSVNALMTASYWEIGRRIVEFEQDGQERAAYGEALLLRLAEDLSARFGSGFSRRNLQQMRLFYLAWPPEQIWQTPSAKSPVSEIPRPPSGEFLPLANSETQSRNSIDLPALARRALHVLDPELRCHYTRAGDQRPFRIGVPQPQGRVLRIRA